MVYRHHVNPEAQADAHVFGATMAREHLRPLIEKLLRNAAPEADAVDVVLDFSRVASATSSYLKRSVLWLYDCAQLAAEGTHPKGSDDPLVPLNIYVFVASLCDEVRGELEGVLNQQNRICLEVPPAAIGSIHQARLLGPLDPALRETLETIVRLRRATATELHQVDITGRTVNAWNNRLSDLFCKRLARRSKVGRHWVYEPVVPEVQVHG